MLTVAQSRAAFIEVLSGDADDAKTRDLLQELHQRGETVEEIIGALEAAWAVRTPLTWVAPPDAIDTCGTGGDGLQTFNVSTTVALAAAAMGIPVIKHGNRAMSSQSGSADVLQALGIPLEPTADEALGLLRARNFAFLYAPLYHPGFARVAPIRKTLGHRSIFNLMGPLLNPAGVKRQVVGVYAPEWVEPIAQVLLARGATRAMVVHGAATDELTTWGESLVAEIDGGHLSTRRFTAPMKDPVIADIQGCNPAASSALLRSVLAGTAPAAALELTALNLAAAKWVHSAEGAQFETHYASALDFLKSGTAAHFWSSLR